MWKHLTRLSSHCCVTLEGLARRECMYVLTATDIFISGCSYLCCDNISKLKPSWFIFAKRKPHRYINKDVLSNFI
jgi:hypothetical protein